MLGNMLCDLMDRIAIGASLLSVGIHNPVQLLEEHND